MTLEEVKIVTTTFLWFSLHSIKSLFFNTRFVYKESDGKSLAIKFNQKTYKYEDIQNAMTATILLVTLIFLSFMYKNYAILILITTVWVFF